MMINSSPAGHTIGDVTCDAFVLPSDNFASNLMKKRNERHARISLA